MVNLFLFVSVSFSEAVVSVNTIFSYVVFLALKSDAVSDQTTVE